jgi:hypothetical protein
MRFWGLVIFFLPIFGFTQGVSTKDFSASAIQSHLRLGLEDDSWDLSSNGVDKLVSKLVSKRPAFRRDEDFVRFLFNKTHQKLLKNYREFSTFEDLIAKGEYNCLTGTMLYALLLKYFGFDYQIIETNYHIFLLVELGGSQVLFEATDPLNGFVHEDSEIKERIDYYKRGQNYPQVSRENKNRTFHQFSFDLYNSVTLDQMKGLLYYNGAVNAYNSKELGLAINYLDNAIAIYQSPRMEELAKIIFVTVSSSNLPDSIKEQYMLKVRAMYKQKYEILASN